MGDNMAKPIAVVIVAVLALAACGSSGTTSSGSKGGGSNNGGSSDGKDDFGTLLSKNKAAKYKVTYATGSESPFTIAQDPPRFSYSSGDSSTYVTASGSAISCSGKGSDATCTELPGSGSAIQQAVTAGFGAIGALFVENAGKGIPGLSDIATTSGKTIAGRDAECATLDKSSLGVFGAALGSSSYSVCVDKDTGVLLSSKADDGKGNVSEITATSFGEPSDTDLTPPATPGTLPGVTIPTIPTT
jgi:hypothetical protein